jgi:GTP pyrophosphokinase
MPKPNRYQSIHTTVLGESGDPFEIQIRTRAMHRVAEYGIAAHWKYKEGVAESREEVRLSWLRQTLEWQKDMKDPQEFMETLKVDLFSNQVFVFTPKGDVIELPSGSTPLDFAFKIHTDVGAKCIGAKVNGKMVPIDYTLKNGQIIDIVTSSNSKPSIDWLHIAKSSNARSKIRQWMKRENRTENAEKGREMLEKSVRRKGYDPRDVVRSQWLNRAVKTLRFSAVEELYTSISYGGAILNKVSSAIISYYEEDTRAGIRHTEKKEEKARNASAERGNHKGDGAGVSINGVDHLLIRLARCCNPVPGDEIIGFITKGRGVSVHRKDCSNITSISLEEKDRLIAVNWNKAEKNQVYDAEVTVLADERKGLFSDIARVCEDMDVHIAGVNAKSVRDGVTNIVLTLSISNTGQMERIRNVLRNVAGVMDVYRSMT